MTGSQTDVDRVMAAFGAAPIAYRPAQEPTTGQRPNTPTPAASAAGPSAESAPSAKLSERILPGAGGQVREIFPLLWRAVPAAGDMTVTAVRRAGDEMPEALDRDPPVDQPLANRFDAAAPRSATAPSPSPDPPIEPPRQQVAAAPEPVLPPAIVAPPLAPLRSHADLVRPVVTAKPAAADQAPAAPSQPEGPQPQWAPQAPQPSPLPYPPQPPAMPPQLPAAMPPQTPFPYPIPPGMAVWPQPILPPQGYPPPYGYAYPPQNPGYMAYPPPYPPPYPAPYSYGYPQPPPYPGQAVPPAYPPPYSPPNVQAPPTGAAPPRAPSSSTAKGSLSDIFAALQRAPGGQTGEEPKR